MRLQCAALLRNSRNLGLLREDPRISISELARRIGMSAPAVRERVLRLEEAGNIRGYTLELDPVALGYPLCAVRPARHGFVGQLRIRHRHLRWLRALHRDVPGEGYRESPGAVLLCHGRGAGKRHSRVVRA